MPSARGSREPQPLGRHERSGKAREVGPEARRPPSDHKAEKPSWKGWLIDAQVPVRPVGRCRAADRSARRARGRSSTCASRGDRHARAANDRRDPRPDRFSKDGDPAHTCCRLQRRAARSTAPPAATGARRWGAFGDADPDHQGRASRLRGGRPVRHLLVVLGQLPPGLRGRVRRCRRSPATTSCSSRAASARGCVEPTPLRIASAPGSAQPGQAVRRARRGVAVTYDSSFNADHDGGAGERARPSPPAGARSPPVPTASRA